MADLTRQGPCRGQSRLDASDRRSGRNRTPEHRAFLPARSRAASASPRSRMSRAAGWRALRELMLTSDDPLTADLRSPVGSAISRILTWLCSAATSALVRTSGGAAIAASPAASSRARSMPNPEPRYKPSMTKPAASLQMHACVQYSPGFGCATPARSNRRIAMMKMALTAAPGYGRFCLRVLRRHPPAASETTSWRSCRSATGRRRSASAWPAMAVSSNCWRPARETTRTLLITLPNGPTCLLAAGQDWQLPADGRARRARHLETRPAAPNRRAADTNRSHHVQAGASRTSRLPCAGTEGRTLCTFSSC